MDWIRDYDVDACLWIGGPGQEGLRAVGEMLCGDRVPSGKLADTYTASSLSAPAMQNFGNFIYTNATQVDQVIDTRFYDFTNSQGQTVSIKNAGAYVVEAEGIYVSYKYYETRYEDCVLGQGNAASSAGTFCSAGGGWNYADEVVYPFGYGLSYTQFEQKLDSVKVDGDMVTVTATVTNTGTTYSGRDVVEVYVQAPYTTGGVEKAAVQLCGFTKTDELAPGQSQQVTVTVDMHDMASYDYKDAKTYILDAGDYYFAIGNGAHDALNNILAAKGMTMENGMDAAGNAALAHSAKFSATKYDTDPVTGNPVTNLFDNADLNHYYDGMVTYLSRRQLAGYLAQELQ